MSEKRRNDPEYVQYVLKMMEDPNIDEDALIAWLEVYTKAHGLYPIPEYML